MWVQRRGEWHLTPERKVDISGWGWKRHCDFPFPAKKTLNKEGVVVPTESQINAGWLCSSKSDQGETGQAPCGSGLTSGRGDRIGTEDKVRLDRGSSGQFVKKKQDLTVL